MIPPPLWDHSLCRMHSEWLPTNVGGRPPVVGVLKEGVG